AALDGLVRRHTEVAAALEADAGGALSRFIHEHFEDVRAAHRTIASGGINPGTLDVVAAAGELLSSRIVAAAMAARGLPSAWVDAREVIVTDARHTAALPLTNET